MTANQPQEPTTFIEGRIDGVRVAPLVFHVDGRGWLVELYRSDVSPPDDPPAMVYVSQTVAGEHRGPHEHRQQTDYLAFVGPGEFTLYLWDSRADSATRGHRMTLVVGEKNPVGVVIPPGVVHAYKNTGDAPALAFNAPNRLYAGEGKRSAVDEIRHEDRRDHPYRLD